VGICLFGAMTASAFAHEFVASKYKHTISEVEPVKTVSKAAEEEELQEFNFGRYHVICRLLHGKGLITEPVSSTLTTHVNYSKCGYFPGGKKEAELGFIGFGAQITGGITFALEVNGAAELVGNESGEEFEYGTKAELRETSALIKITNRKYCTLIIPTQTVPAVAVKKPEGEYSAVTYSNDPVAVEETPTKLKMFPGGFQHKLIISLQLKAIKFRFNEETQCGEHEPKIEKGGGLISGGMTMEIPGGNLEFH